MRFAAILRFVRLENDGGRNHHPLSQRRQVFTLVIVLLFLSIACVAPGVATATTKDDQRLATHSKNLERTDGERLGALETGVTNDCTPTNSTKTGNCTATKTNTSSGCYAGANRTTATQPNTADPGSTGTSTEHTTDSGPTVTSSSNTRTTMAEPNTKASQRADQDQANAPGSSLLPDINSPIIAVIGILCVMGGVLALTR